MLIHADQMGFMPGKETDTNLWWIFTNISVLNSSGSPSVVASLDGEKAFHSIEWAYLWEVLHKFWFWPGCRKYIQNLRPWCPPKIYYPHHFYWVGALGRAAFFHLGFWSCPGTSGHPNQGCGFRSGSLGWALGWKELQVCRRSLLYLLVPL